MDHGQLIRQLRKERCLTQTELSDEISSRTTLASLEQGGSRISFENMVAYCRKMNVTLEEYEFLYEDSQICNKRETAKLVSRSFKMPYDQNLAVKLKQKYEESHDFYYYSLYAQYYLVKHVAYDTAKSFQELYKSDPEIAKISVRIRKYLEGVYTWGRFELTLFTNCLFIFDDKYIWFQYHETINKMRIFTDSSNYSDDLLKFLINGTQLSFDRNDFPGFRTFLDELKLVANVYGNTKAELVVRIFDILDHSRIGLDVSKDMANLNTTLSFLGEQRWLDYVADILRRQEANSTIRPK